MSHKRSRSEAKNIASSALISIDGDVSTFFTFTGSVMNINHGGTFRIVERDSLSPFRAKPRYLSWQPTLNIPPAANGPNIVYVDNTNTVKVANVNDLPKLPAYDPSTLDMNDVVQLASVAVTNGTITSGGPQIQWDGNAYNRRAAAGDALGAINSLSMGVDISIVPGTLGLNVLEGRGVLRDAGFINNEGTKSSDTVFVPNIPNSFLTLGDRNNVIRSFGTSLNTAEYEPSPGNFVPISPNKASGRDTLVFPVGKFIGYMLLTQEQNTVDLVMTSPEIVNIPTIGTQGLSIKRIGVGVGETDLSNAGIKNNFRLL